MLHCASSLYTRELKVILLYQPFQNHTIPRKSPSPLPYERSVGFASLRNFGRSTSGIHARPLSKVRCCRPIKFGRRPEGLPHHHPSPRTNPSKTALSHSLFVMPTSICTIRFHIRTILFAFRRGVGLPLPLHQSLLFSLIFVKEHLSLALLAPPVAPNTAIPTQPLQKNNNPSLNTFLQTKRPHLITGAVLLILNLTALQDYRQAD